ncbi:thiamine diphosphokinase [Paragemmobacter straminiformis]|uniref:Thiamine diphosphokinase n=1 Tax=Paragemmobacter straminiformis TaxID=2045119 RepID=A0A842I2S8_9RHOB|nr:thiamine diphosphokinase [Gemmobacter straminiformis]MBC2833951.1 thiamine diphosphokinase [Gemmobacter straminiformis]
MNRPIVQSRDGITLVGGGPVSKAELALALRIAPRIVAADGGADRVLAAGLMPEAVVGDFDSISAHARGVIPAGRQHVIAEQATTDFDKALRSVDAPFVLALGFAGARIDHGLAVLNGMVRQAERVCLLIGPRDVVFHAPARLDLRLRVGDRLSLFPMREVTGRSAGLEWPIDGIGFAPDGMIGTSNRVVSSRVRLEMDGAGMLVILPRGRLGAALTALRPEWTPRAA